MFDDQSFRGGLVGVIAAVPLAMVGVVVVVVTVPGAVVTTDMTGVVVVVMIIGVATASHHHPDTAVIGATAVKGCRYILVEEGSRGVWMEGSGLGVMLWW